MSAEAVKMLVKAFISCRLDYCNSLFYGIAEGLTSRLQFVQNALSMVAWLSANAMVSIDVVTLVYAALG